MNMNREGKYASWIEGEENTGGASFGHDVLAGMWAPEVTYDLFEIWGENFVQWEKNDYKCAYIHDPPDPNYPRW